MPKMQSNETSSESSSESQLDLCRFLQNAPLKKLLLKDGRRITDATLWNELIPPVNEDNGRTFSLIQAYLKNDEEAVKSFLNSEDSGINDVGADGETPLGRVVANNSVPVVELFLQRGADPNVKEKITDSFPLMKAAKEGFDCVLKLLLQYGASVSQTTNTGYTALHYAAANGHIECVRLLLEHGSPLEEQNEHGHTPLMEATSNGHIDVAKCLIENGANINTHSTEFKESALTLASYKGHANMVRFLLDAGASHEHRTDEMHTALMEAAMEGHIEVAKMLLAHGANVNIPQDSFESPLTLAACGGHTELALILIGYEADIEEVNDEGYTPLMEAAREGHEDTVAVLLAAGANVNAKTDETQETALTLAACGGFIEVCEILLKAGADLEAGNPGCSTPLMEAAQEGHFELVSRLLHRGAKVNALTTSGDTALHYAAENGHAKVCNELLKWGANMDQPVAIENYKTPLMKAARAGHLEVVQLLIEWGFPVNQATAQKDATALSLACNGGHVQVVEYLLRNDANPHYELRDGCTMLIEAARSGSPAVFQLILDYPKILSLSQRDGGIDQQTPHPPPPPPPPLMQTTPELGQLQNGDAGVALVSTQLGEAATAVMHQHAAAAAAVAMHQQQQCASLAVRQALNAHPAHHPQLKEALANAYAAGWADGAASRAQRSANQLQTALSSGSHVCSSEKFKKPNQSQKATLIPEKISKAQSSQLNSANMDTLPVSKESIIDTFGESPLSIPTDEFRSRLMSIFHDWKGDGSDFLHQLGTVMSCPGSASGRPTSCNNKGTTAAATSTISNLPNLMKCSEAGSGDATTESEYLRDISQTRVQTYEPFSPPPPPPTNTSSASSVSSSSASSSSERNAASVCSSISSVPSSSAQLVCKPGVTPSVTTYYHHAPKEEVATCPLEVVHSLAQAITLSSPTVVGQRPISSSPQLPLATSADPALYDQLTSGASTITPQPLSSVPTSTTDATTQPVDINACIESSMESALTLACNGGFVDLARLLLERGADKEHKDKKSHTPLHTAVYANQRQIVSLLLDYGADIEAQVERTKDTALSISCSHGRLEISEELLNRGANKEHRNFSDYTPLSLAASGGFVDVIQLLLRYGAEINSRTGSKLGISPLMLASMNGYTDAVRVLLEHGSDINAQIETNKNTALTLACFQGQHEVVKILVEHKANIEHRAKTGLTPLMEAASGNHVKVGYILLEHGADVNALPVLSSRDTALTIASDKGKTEFVNLLLNQGALVEARNKKGATSLWLACNGGHFDVVESLIAAHADVNSQDNRKVSCLMAAFRKGHVKVVSLLVQYVTQFPSDKDCLRHIKVIATEKELTERCQQCRKIISAAKEKQEGEARKNADVLLEQIEQEEEEKANKEAMQARKRERKRNKRKAKQENAALAAAKDKPNSTPPVEESESKKSPSEEPIEKQTTKEQTFPSEQFVSEVVGKMIKQQSSRNDFLSNFSPEKEIETAKNTTLLQNAESKREKHRTKKQAQRTSKRNDAAHIISGSAAVSPPVNYKIPTQFDTEASFWDPSPFEHSPDTGSLTNASEWLVVQPTSGNRGHRSAATAAANSTDVSSPAAAITDWKTTGTPGSGTSAKRKVALSVSKHDIGKIIGQGGAVVSALRTMSGIQIDIESARGDEVTERMVYLRGPADIVQRTYQTIQDLLSGALAGNDVILRAKSSSKVSPTLGLSTTFSSAVMSSSIPTTGAGSTSAKKTASVPKSGNAIKVPPMQNLPTPQPLMSKLTSPLCLKTTTSSNSNPIKVVSTSNSWIGAKSSATPKGNFASVAAAGVTPTKDTKRTKSTAQTSSYSPTGTPVSLMSIGALADVNLPMLSTTPLTVLDDQSFPPLLTVATDYSTTSTSKHFDVTSRNIGLSETQTEDSFGQASLPPLPASSVTEKPLHMSVMDSVTSAPPKTVPASHVSMSITGASRTFARAPGSERSAQRHAVTSTSGATTGPINLSDPVGGMVVTPTKRVPVSSTFAVEPHFNTKADQGPSIASTPRTPPQASNSLDSLYATSQRQTPRQFGNVSQQLWSDFSSNSRDTNTFSGGGGGGSYDYASNTGPATNQPQFLHNTIGMRNFEASPSTGEDVSQFFPSHLQSSYRLSQQSSGCGSIGGSKPIAVTPHSEAFAAAFSTASALAASAAAAAASVGRNSTFLQRDYPLLFNGLGNGNAVSTPSRNSSVPFLPPRFNPVHQQQIVPPPPKPQQGFMHPHQLLNSQQQQQPGDHNCYVGALGPASSGNIPSTYGFTSAALQAGVANSVIAQPHPQPTPIGAERRRCHQGPVATGSSHGAPPISYSTSQTVTSQSVFGSGAGMGSSASQNAALMALLSQQHRSQPPPPHHLAPDPSTNNNHSWPQPPPALHPQGGHPAFWSQNVGNGLGNSNVPSQQQQSLMANASSAVPAWTNMWPWPNQPSTPGVGTNSQAAIDGSSGGGGSGGCGGATSWMMSPQVRSHMQHQQPPMYRQGSVGDDQNLTGPPLMTTQPSQQP